MAERPDNLRQYVRDAVAEGEEYATRYAWVIEDDGTMYYTCKNCGRVFDGHHAFAGHCGSYRNKGCGVQPGERQTSSSSIIAAVLANDGAPLEPSPARQALDRRAARRDARRAARLRELRPEPARRWWWPW